MKKNVKLFFIHRHDSLHRKFYVIYKKKVTRINEYNIVVRHKTDIKDSILFLYTKNNQIEMKKKSCNSIKKEETLGDIERYIGFKHRKLQNITEKN